MPRPLQYALQRGQHLEVEISSPTAVAPARRGGWTPPSPSHVAVGHADSGVRGARPSAGG